MTRLAIVTCVRDEGWDIAEWIAFHLLVGAERILIFDNESSDNTVEVASAFERFNVSVRRVSGEGRQMHAFEMGLAEVRDNCDWVAFLDADEYLYAPNHDGLPVALGLEQFSAVSGVAVHWVNYGSSYHLERPRQLVGAAFRSRAFDHFPQNQIVKSIVRPADVHRVMLHTMPTTAGTVDELGNCANKGNKFTPISFSTLRINHYPVKSRMHWEKKIAGGDGIWPGKIRREYYWDMRDRNDVVDPLPAMYVDGTRDILREVFGQDGGFVETRGDEFYRLSARFTMAVRANDLDTVESVAKELLPLLDSTKQRAAYRFLRLCKEHGMPTVAAKFSETLLPEVIDYFQTFEQVWSLHDRLSKGVLTAKDAAENLSVVEFALGLEPESPNVRGLLSRMRRLAARIEPPLLL